MTEAEAQRRQITGLAALLDLEREAREAATPAALAFVMVNRTRLVLPYDTAAAWSAAAMGAHVDAVASVSLVDQSGPFAQWLRGQLAQQDTNSPIFTQTGAWSEAPPQALWCRLPAMNAGFVLLRRAPWQAADIQIAERLAATYGHARMALGRNRWHKPRNWRVRPWMMAIGAAMLAVVLALPIRQSTIAQATIIARTPVAVTAPNDGVIAEVMVLPYQSVTAGQVLIRFDATQARGRLQLARNSEKVAAADLLKNRQRAFSDAESGARLSSSSAQLDLHRSEAAFAEELLDRTLVKADRAGLALFDDPQDWTGKPVSVGERIMVLADPAEVMLHVALPADDAFLLEPGAPVAFFLNIDPLHEIAATVTHVAYEANLGPEGFLSYRLTADFAPGEPLPRIGLKGVATVYGDKISLARFLFRKPLTTLRRWLRL